MPSTYSSNLKIELMATGENANTWGTITNTNLGTALEQAIVGYGNPSFASDANLTITITNSNSAQAARALVLNVTSAVSLTATRELVVPTIEKPYTVQNNTTGGQSITVKTASGTGVTVPSGRKAYLYVDGTNVVQMFDFVDINGGTIDGAAIGASSASSGSFTSVSSSGAVSLGNGTVGTPALNATADTNTGLYFPAADSFGVVTGGAERIRVDSTGLVGLNTNATSSYGGRLNVYGGDIVVADAGTSSGASAPRIGSSSQALLFKTNTGGGSASEVARFDGSGNLLVGDTSLPHEGGIYLRRTSGVAAIDAFAASTAEAKFQLLNNNNSSAIGNGSGGELVFYANSRSTERMRLEASGNLGIGTSSPSARLHVAAAGDTVVRIAPTSSGTARLNMAGTGGGAAAIRSEVNGLFFENTDTGPFTYSINGSEQMRLTSTGLGIGTSSPISALGFGETASSTGITFQSTNTTFNSGKTGVIKSVITGSGNGSLVFETYAGGSGGGERARIDASGNLGIGTSSPISKLDVNSGYITSGTGASTIGTKVLAAYYSSGHIATWGTEYANGGPVMGYGVWPSTSSAGSFVSATPIAVTRGAFTILGNNHIWYSGGLQTVAIDSPVSTSEAMRLNGSGNLGIGTSSPASKLNVVGDQLIVSGGAGTSQLGVQIKGAPLAAIPAGQIQGYIATGDSFIGTAGDLLIAPRTDIATSIRFITGATPTERMRLDASGNLGIGTSSPAEKLDVSGNAIVRGTSTVMLPSTSSFAAIRGFTGGSGNLVVQPDAGSGSAWWISAKTVGILAIGGNGGSEPAAGALNIDTSGNLGIGTSSPAARLHAQFGGVGQATPAALFFSNNDGFAPQSLVGLAIYNNRTSGFLDTNLVYGNSVNSYLAIGHHNGTTYNERMRLDASGNLGLGVTPNAWGSAQRKAVQIGTAALAGISGTEVAELGSNWYINSSGTATYMTTNVATLYQQAGGSHKWYAAPSGTAGNAISFTQAMTLNSSGSLVVGSTTANRAGANTGISAEGASTAILEANINASRSGFLYADAASTIVGEFRNFPLIFRTNDTERARIDSSGNLLVGTTTIPSSTNAGFTVALDASGTYLRNACTVTTTRTHFEFVNGNGTVGTISTNASATAYNTSSDRRLKENIAPAADAGAVIDAIEVVQHDWKTGGHTSYGVIAQDLNAVAPEAVTAGDDGDEIEKTWGVDYSKLVPMLVKEIQSLRARVAALESQP